MTVLELYTLLDKEKSGKWSIKIYDLAGMVSFGHVNSVYPVTAVPDEILSEQVVSFTIGYESLFVKIDVTAKVYESDKECERDGYQLVYGTRYASFNTLYSKKVDGMREFAVVDLLAGIKKGSSSSE